MIKNYKLKKNMGGGGSNVIKNPEGKIEFINKDERYGKVKPYIGKSLIDFEIKNPLGKGRFGQVFLVKSKITNYYYAMKKIKKNNNKDMDNIRKEIALLNSLKHPHVINYFTSFFENDSYYIIIEYIDGISLQNLIDDNIKQKKYLEEKKIWNYLIQCLSGLIYLHQNKKIIHRDIKPDNLMLEKSGNIKISDFGISAIDDVTIETTLKFHNTLVGPMNFFAPEVIEKKGYDFKSDIYMLGATFFLLSSNEFYITRQQIGKKVSKNETNATIPNIYSDELKNFIMNLLKDKDNRPNSEEAFNEALYIYTFKYLKVTSMISLFLCFYSMKGILDIFNGNQIADFIYNKNQENKYMYTKLFKEMMDFISYNNYEQMRQSCLYLIYLFYKDKKDINNSSELSIFDFILFIIKKMNKELHDNTNDIKYSLNNEIIDISDENSVRDNFFKKWKNIVSTISDEFYFLVQIESECLICNNIIKYKIDCNIILELYPNKASSYLGKKNLIINDLFLHFDKKRKYTDQYIFCKFCNGYQKETYETKNLLSCPPNLIFQIVYEDNQFNLIIEEEIDIKDFVKNDDCETKYILMGAIFFEYNNNNEKIFTSITRTIYNQWIYFNGINIQNCDFNSLKNHKNLQYLFYSYAK